MHATILLHACIQWTKTIISIFVIPITTHIVFCFWDSIEHLVHVYYNFWHIHMCSYYLLAGSCACCCCDCCCCGIDPLCCGVTAPPSPIPSMSCTQHPHHWTAGPTGQIYSQYMANIHILISNHSYHIESTSFDCLPLWFYIQTHSLYNWEAYNNYGKLKTIKWQRCSISCQTE